MPSSFLPALLPNQARHLRKPETGTDGKSLRGYVDTALSNSLSNLRAGLYGGQ